MRVLIVADNDLIDARVRAITTRLGLTCEPGVLGLEAASQAAGRLRHAILVLVMPPDAQRGLAALQVLCQSAAAAVIVVGVADDPKFLLHVLRHGAEEYVDLEELDSDLGAALGRVKAKQVPRAVGSRIIGVLGASGGSGASTVAANLAVALAHKGGRSALVDLRVSAGDQTLLLDLKPAHTLTDLCRKYEQMDAGMFQLILTRHHSGVHLLAAPARLADAAQVTPQGVQRALSLARDQFPFVVIDLDRTFGPEQLPAIAEVDLMLLVLRLDMTSLSNAQRMLERLEELQLSEHRIRVVVNRYGQPGELPVGKAEEALRVRLAHFIPNDSARVNAGNNKGVPVLIEQPRSKVARRLVELALSAGQLENGHTAPGRSLLARWWPATALR